MSTKLHLVRHGYTPNNHAGYTGQNLRYFFKHDEYCPLEKKYGIDQVKELGQYINGILSGRKVLFIVSPYYRSRETLHYILESIDSLENCEVIMEKSLIEINQGLQYGYPKTKKYDFDNLTEEDLKEIQSLPEYEQEVIYAMGLQKSRSKQGYDSEYIPYMQGESLSDVRRRTRHFAKQLKKIVDSGEYDDVVIISHNTVLKTIYRYMKGHELTSKTFTASAITLEEGKDDIQFNPTLMVPKEHVIDTDDYKNYKMIYDMQKSIDSKKADISFQRYIGGRSLQMPTEEDCVFIQKEGETLVILPNNNEQQGYFYIDTSFGQDYITMDKGSESTYYILEGCGTFFVKSPGESEYREIFVSASEGTNIITISPNTIFYYESDLEQPLKMFERMRPNFKEENIVIISETPRLAEHKSSHKKL